MCAVLHNFCLQYDSPSYILELIDKFERTHENRVHFTDDYLQKMEPKKNVTMDLVDKDDNDDDDRVISSIYDNSSTANSKWEALKESFLKDRGQDIYMLDHSNDE